jgi:hypothetical protein
MYGITAKRTVTKLCRVRRMECRIMFRVFMVTLELYFCSSELVRKILMIPKIVTPVLANVIISHKIGEIVYQALAYH